ncbi:glutathione peroxidase [Teredinibacter sp. KSP-S5-2]|uniref:glutathione peroxidase n=1 Tax=Teredinibacter sp. KSP-S5-2 TaxID=3034506 RepID=UPI0029341649|nr:glutathione peroxidase [Teredinibacter sp. KSP-S5-2]WNO07614.1 glutathione peroxidase [Teredinibacter sp. KSP-S5-2]
MKKLLKILLAPILAIAQIAGISTASAESANLELPADGSCPSFLNQTFRKLHSSDEINLCQLYQGKPLLIVNTASHCGFTPQFKGLEALYKKYQDQGFHIIGFSSNDFKQAAKTEEKAAEICYKNYGVSFTMLAQTKVRGKKANPVFQYLADKTSKPSWNFNKYLILPKQNKLLKFGSSTKPQDSQIEEAIRRDLETN